MSASSSRMGFAALSGLVLAGLVACGGSSGPEPTPIHRVYVAGDSLADVGTFGFKFTVQDAKSPKGFPIWPQLVANQVGLDGTAQCSFYRISSTNPLPTLAPECTNFAIGGARVVVSAAQGGKANPLTIGTQLQARAQLGSYTANDLLLLDGGGNDAADLIGAYLGAASGAQGLANYQAFLAQQLEPAVIASLLPLPDGAALLAGAYMQKLADTLYADIKAHALDKGADRIVVLNMPDVSLTPRFSAVLAGVAVQAGSAASAQLQGAIQQWIGAFNQQLKTRTANDKRIVIVDFFGEFAQQVAKPASFGLSNATQPVCPVTGTDSLGLPTYSFAQCTSAALDALPGKTPNWWTQHMFSDGFHPTPYAHTLMAQSVTRSLQQAGWR